MTNDNLNFMFNSFKCKLLTNTFIQYIVNGKVTGKY